MSSVDAAHDAAAALNERTPLIRHATNASSKPTTFHQSNPPVPAATKRRVIFGIYAFAFVLMFGMNLEPAARVQLYQDVLCQKYYDGANKISGSLQPAPPNVPPPPVEDRCKVQPIQDELALIKGYEYFFAILPTIFCTIPYGRLADRVGRRAVLILSTIGVVTSEMWILAVTYVAVPWGISLRWLWLNSMLYFIGGGSTVAGTLAHVIIVDVTEESERTQTFLFIHGMNVVSGTLAPMVSAALMETGHVWLVALLGVGLLILGTLCLPLLPETLHLRQKTISADDLRTEEVSSTTIDPVNPTTKGLSTLPSRLLGSMTTFFQVTFAPFASNPQALLLLFLYCPSLLFREVFNLIGLIYFGKKFHWPFSRVNILLAGYAVLQAVTTLFLLPGLVAILSSATFPPRSWRLSAWRRDRMLAIAGLAALALGTATMGVAPSPEIAVAGLVFMGLAAGVSSTLLSLLGSSFEKKHVSTVYSTALTLGVVFGNGIGPVFSALFSVGMRLGWGWTGLPFMVVAGLAAVVMGGAGFIEKENGKKGRGGHGVGEVEEEEQQQQQQQEEEEG